MLRTRSTTHSARLRRGTLPAAALLLSLGLALPGPAAADPPPWAPAHGWRAKHKDKHRHKGAEPVYVVPYGIGQNTCNREMVGGILGGIAGGVAGSTLGKGDGRLAAVAGGTILGVIVGGAVGRAMDQTDQACVGQILEHAADRQRVAWAGEGSRYDIEPVRTWQAAEGRFCREYTARAVIGGRDQKVFGQACRNPDGSWQLVD